VHQRAAAIVLVDADLEYADNAEASQARQETHRRCIRLRRHHGDAIPRNDIETVGEPAAEDDAVVSGNEIVESTELHVFMNLGDGFFMIGIDAADQGAADRGTVADHGLGLGIGGAADYRGMFERLLAQGFPVLQRATKTAHRNVRNHAQYAAAQFLLETVHHRQHHDQRHHAERDSQHRYQGDEGDKMVASFGARVTQADEYFQGHLHARD